ncbi:MAG: histidine ammonia-lyase [Verrucomicrobiae bacterium]|jgi:histidine ammonia-lyase|nr:histidine ammonia-lyase [Verrucomicrobiae bacterium]
MKNSITLTESGLSLAELRTIYFEPTALHVASSLKIAIERSAAVVTQTMKEGKTVYGINTGFGALASTRIEPDKLAELQLNIIRSHKAGVGAYLDEKICKLVLALKIVGLSAGYSGVRWILVEKLLELFNRGFFPCLHAKGSVGSSGDLAPLADLAGVLIGEGDAWFEGNIISAQEVLKIIDWKPYVLGPKEGLSLINGTQVSTGLALAALFKTERLLGSTIVSGALAIEAIKGSISPFHPKIQELRRQQGQQQIATWSRELLGHSSISESHRDCGKVQDPYSMRCQAVVMGTCLDTMNYVASILQREANAITDNPIVIPETGEVISGGNFHAEPVAFAADHLALAIAEMTSIAERRIAMLMDRHFSGLPSFLVTNSGLHSGLMIAHVTAAAMVSENKSLSHPASVDSIPTSANQEDHVSMATSGARRLHEMLENAGYVTAIELLSTIRAVAFHLPLKTSERLEKIMKQLSPLIQLDSSDHVLSPEIEAMQQAVLGGRVATVVLEIDGKPNFHDCSQIGKSG